MKAIKILVLLIVCVAFVGCEEGAKKTDKKTLNKKDDGKIYLSMNFEQGKVAKYKFTSEREIDLHWDPNPDPSKPAAKNKVDHSTEKVELVMTYEPVEVDPYGLTKIKCSCLSVIAERKNSKKKASFKADAAKSFANKSFTLSVGPTGKIEDYSELEKVLKEVGDKAFREGNKGMRVKEPDLIEDIIASQWFLWNSVSSLTSGSDGIEKGAKWQSVLSAPTPLVTTQARSVEYELSEIRKGPEATQLVIKSNYSPAERSVISWPMPYSGRFQVSGPFGFLTMFIKNFAVTSLEGSGSEVLDAETCLPIRYKQNYHMVVEATAKSALGTKPRLEIKQSFTMQKLDQ